MPTTESTATHKLPAALSAFLGEIKDPKLDGTNPHFKSRYSTLSEVLQTVRPVLAKHKLAVCQVPEHREGKPLLVTRLMHAEGEVIESTLLLPETANMQAMGGAITYARRYALTAMLGVAGDEDDDGNHAAATAKGSAPAPATKPQPPRQQSAPAAGAGEAPPPFPSGVDEAHPYVLTDEPWEECIIPFGKNKGKRISELPPASAKWYCQNYEAKRPGDEVLRRALNDCARALGFDKGGKP